MKTWIRDREGNEEIPTFTLIDGGEATTGSIAPTEQDPAELVSSDRTDGYEHVVWHEAIHLVYSIDLELS